MRRFTLPGILVLFFLIVHSLPSLQAEQDPELNYAQGEVLVAFEDDATALDRIQARNEVGSDLVRTFRSGAQHWRFDAREHDVADVVAWLQNNPAVKYAHPNYKLVPASCDEDPCAFRSS